MFDLRLDEIPLPAGKNDREKLISWLIDTLCLHRRRGENAADDVITENGCNTGNVRDNDDQ